MRGAGRGEVQALQRVQSFPLGYTRRYRLALELAEKAHRGTTRKAGDKPYLLHLVTVSNVLAKAGADDDLVIAGLLHDIVEDTDVTIVEIEDSLGGRVARLVAGVTKTDHDAAGRRFSSQEKLELTEETMRDAHSDVCALKAADLLANMTDLIIDQQDDGYDHWRDLFGDRAEAKLTHYARLGEILVERLSREQTYPALAGSLADRLTQFQGLIDRWPRDQIA